jgi:alpha-glucosidase
MTKSKWGNRVIYQIYPRSFKDSNGDGVGDLQGIIDKLKYLKELGIDGIWLSPIYPSPMKDFGYDISDYENIDNIFGDLNKFKELVKKAHLLNIKVLMDFVPNHTSDKHPWFKESRLNKKNSKRDWYIWQSPDKNGEPPNNWVSQFGGSAWELDKKTREYYLHTFDVSQPDLNWRNPEVVKKMLDTMRFWLRNGVDGFRIDVAYLLYKDPFLRDEPPNPSYNPEINNTYDSLLHIYTSGLPETLNMLKVFNQVMNEFDDRFMICEIHTYAKEIIKLYKIVDHHSFAPFNFSFFSIPWNATEQKNFLDEFNRLLGHNYFPTYVLGNHDQPRVATKLGDKNARSAALLQLTLRGIPFIYYGEELGLKNVTVPIEKVRDPMAINMKNNNFGRDPERGPMQWNKNEFAGFSDSEPWLPVEKDYADKNVLTEEHDPKSFLNLYKKLIFFRKKLKSLSSGIYLPLEFNNQNIFGFIREFKNEKALILINFSKEVQVIKLPEKKWKILFSTYMDILPKEANSQFKLRPSESFILYKYAKAFL